MEYEATGDSEPRHEEPTGSSTDSPHDGDLTAFKQDLIAVIAEGPIYGLAIKRTLEAYYGVDEVYHGRIYPNLDDLVERGLVTKRERDGRTNEYELTRSGRAYLRARVGWLGQHLDDEHRLANAEPATQPDARTDGGDEQ